MTHTQLLTTFAEIAQALNTQLGSIPVLYGSLGLAQQLAQAIAVDDIDILVERAIFEQQLDKLHTLMTQLGFTLIDAQENEFQRHHIKVGLASDGDLPDFAGIDPQRLTRSNGPIASRRLNLEQFLACYRASSQDGYRRDKRGKNDARKIELIQSELRRR